MADEEVISTNSTAAVNMDANLGDKPAQTKSFEGATLEINASKQREDGLGEPAVEFRGTSWTEADAAKEKNANNLSRNRPYSASMTSRRSTTSVSSRTSVSSTLKTSDYAVGKFFSHREGAFDKAINDCTQKIVNQKLDGEVQGAWLLTEIDHWDNEYEILLLLTDLSVIVIRYDFIKQSFANFRRIMLQIISSVSIGDFVYPPKSLMMPRGHGGVRVRWAADVELTFGQRWNPWCTTVPYLTLSHHPLGYSDGGRESLLYSVDDFHEALTSAITLRPPTGGAPATPRFAAEPIEIESYASFSSMVFNQSHLGFFRERNGVSF